MKLSDKVAFLRRPESYAGVVPEVEAIETHMAWVFLAGERAYKLKKPVRYDFLDFSTLEGRRRDCEEEVRLNRRLAPDVYLGTVPLIRSEDGSLRLGGAGETVEWLVEMRRLPRARMLDRLILEGSLRPEEVRAAAVLLADFFARATPTPLTGPEYRPQLRADAEENRRELLAFCPLIPEADVRTVGEVLGAFVDREGAALEERVHTHRIVEGHGDLRPEHVWLGLPPVVIDCLEFNRAFRLLDSADELAYLSLECERLGAPWLRDVLIGVYGKRTGDRPPAQLVDFYMAHRAFLRAKVALWHLRDGDLAADPERWTARARTYLSLAAAHVARTGVGGSSLALGTA